VRGDVCVTPTGSSMGFAGRDVMGIGLTNAASHGSLFRVRFGIGFGLGEVSLNSQDSTSDADRLYELLLVVTDYGDGEWCAALYDHADGPLGLPVREGWGADRLGAVRDLFTGMVNA